MNHPTETRHDLGRLHDLERLAAWNDREAKSQLEIHRRVLAGCGGDTRLAERILKNYTKAELIRWIEATSEAT